MARVPVVPLLVVALVSVLASPAMGGHLATENSCTVERDSVTAGGRVEDRAFGLKPPSCHHPVGCFAGDLDGCDIRFELTMSGLGYVSGTLDAVSPDLPVESCAGPLTCTLTATYHTNHEIHLNCDAFLTTFAVDVTMTCTATTLA